MIKKELILDSVHWHDSKSLDPIERLESTYWVKSLSKVYSRLLEERISARRTLKLVHAQVAMGMLLLFGGVSILVSLSLCVWAVLAILQCKM